MKFQILYFDGCPSHERLLPTLRLLAEEHGVELEEIRIADIEEAESAHFLGSPTVRVDGTDVDPGAGTRTDYGMKCRLYRTPHSQSGVPPRAWLEDALRKGRHPPGPTRAGPGA